MNRPNVQVSKPGLFRSDWTVSYTTRVDISSAYASQQGSTIVFEATAGGEPYRDQSEVIDGNFSITKQKASGRTYQVTVRYSGSNLNNYFPAR